MVPVDGGIRPTAAHGGSNAIGTRLTGTNYNDSDGGWEISLADSPAFSLAGAVEPTVTFWAWVDTEGSTYDGFNVRASSDGVTYNLANAIPAYPLTVFGQGAWGGRLSAQGWTLYRADLTPLAGQTATRLRVAFSADHSVNYAGVFIDDVRVENANQIQLAVSTSMLPNAGPTFPYSVTATRTGGSSAARWSILAGATNAAWLSIDPVTGVLSGTPLVANLGPVSLTLRISEPGNPSNFAERTLAFAVVQSATVSSLPITGMPATFTPGWGLSLNSGNLYFSVTDSTSSTSAGTTANRNGVGYVSASTGGAYTSVYDANQAGAALDPQVVFHNGANLYAFNGLFSSPRGTAGLYQITGPTAATALSTAASPYGSGSKYSWAANGSNFYITQFTPSPYDVLGANLNVSSSVAMTNVTNDGTYNGPYGVAATATKLYVFDGSYIATYALDMAMSPSVPMVDPMVPEQDLPLAAPCQAGTRTLVVMNSPMLPTKLYYTSWGQTSGSTTNATGRVCEVSLDANGYPTGVAQVTAGPTTSTVGSADGVATAATFQNITGMYFDIAGNRIFMLQKTNSVTAANYIRVLNLP
ncbi:MAG: hypothetical protein JNM69_13595 [Archangium sp.]|nr:hypothetical protein [Archangium sp.]